jgi:mRNA degradation ribonuclease J1/J2
MKQFTKRAQSAHAQFNTQSQDIKIVPLGGLGEVGRNMTILEYQGKF